jgi:hypothetical protein
MPIDFTQTAWLAGRRPMSLKEDRVQLETTIDVRDITDEEIEHYTEKGWVKLPRLISPDVAAELLRRAKAKMGESGHENPLRPGKDPDLTEFHQFNYIRNEDALFKSLVLQPTIGHNAQRLMGRDVPVRAGLDVMAVKLPVHARGKGKGVTAWHQDLQREDRVGHMNVWIALDRVTPEMGSMVFYEGSHRIGPMGWHYGVDEDPAEKDLVAKWRQVLERYKCRMSDPLDYEPGDATVHTGTMLHSAGENHTETPRWAYIITYIPGDARYTGKSSGFSHYAEAAFGERFPTEEYPVVYPT